MTATAADGAGGVTLYSQGPQNLGNIDNPLRGSGKNNWGAFELNPLSTDATTSYNDILTLYNDGIKVRPPPDPLILSFISKRLWQEELVRLVTTCCT